MGIRRALAVVASTLAVAAGTMSTGAHAAGVSHGARSRPAAAAIGTGIRLTAAAGGSFTIATHIDRSPLHSSEQPVPRATAQLIHRGCIAALPIIQRHAKTGQGVLAITMAAPGTSWGSSTRTSVDVDVRVDGRTSQQIVLFDGAQPFTYQGFVGRLRSGSHCVQIAVDAGRGSDASAPEVILDDVRLGVVPKRSRGYELVRHAPVMFGRSTSAQRNAQLLTYGQATRHGRDTDLSYTVIWTREDVGDGIIPAYEWGLFGRMTDIETVLNETIGPHGKVRSANYLSCGCEKLPIYPDALPAPPVLSEQDTAYPAHGGLPSYGHHLEIRDATGNNDISPFGQTRYRFQQVPVAGPPAGASREVAMDRHPWTYRISQLEVARSSLQSTNARSILAGNYPQYLVVDINAAATDAKSIAVGVRLAGDPTWYTNDYAQVTGLPTTFPFYDGGHGRTVIKLPAGWNGTRVTALRLVLNGGIGQPVPRLDRKPKIKLVEVTRQYRIRHPHVPKPTVTTGIQLLPDLPL